MCLQCILTNWKFEARGVFSSLFAAIYQSQMEPLQLWMSSLPFPLLFVCSALTWSLTFS